MQKIEFIPQSETASDLFTAPRSAIKSLPDWYRDMPLHVGGERTSGLARENAFGTNTTAKACSPFLDALSFGYLWVAQADIEVRYIAGQYLFRWRTEGKLVEWHSPDQHPGMPPAHGASESTMKWECPFQIRTPPGFSTLFTHPLNRHDLPFRTFTGVVDTDAYPLNVNFPFHWIGGTEEITIIEAGTPLCQIIPIRRDSWNSSVGVFDAANVRRARFAFFSRVARAYKSRYWNKKVFL